MCDNQIIISIKEVQKLFPDMSDATASRKINLLRVVLNKPKPKLITLKDFKDYFLT